MSSGAIYGQIESCQGEIALCEGRIAQLRQLLEQQQPVYAAFCTDAEAYTHEMQRKKNRAAEVYIHDAASNLAHAFRQTMEAELNDSIWAAKRDALLDILYSMEEEIQKHRRELAEAETERAYLQNRLAGLQAQYEAAKRAEAEARARAAAAAAAAAAQA